MLKWLKSLFGSTEQEPLVLDKPVEPVRKLKRAELAKMTKTQLEDLGRVHGVELDRRLTKDKLVKELWPVVKANQ
jgi:hypothetical protein